MRKVLILADSDTDGGILADALQISAMPGIKFDIDTDRDAPASREKLSQYAAVLNVRSLMGSYSNNTWFSVSAFDSYVKDGGSFIAAGKGCLYDPAPRRKEEKFFLEVDRYNKFLGSRVDETFMGPVHISTVDRWHPIMKGISDFDADEPHRRTVLTAEGAEILFDTSSEKGGSGVHGGYVLKRGSGRVIAITQGLSKKTWRIPGFSAIVANSVRYCAAGRKI
ncbi:MAG: ThuA domain-containing protein [Oscillospiraceae bacterium]|jgi:hypothetical protein